MLSTQDDMALSKVRDGNQVVPHDTSVVSVHLHTLNEIRYRRESSMYLGVPAVEAFDSLVGVSSLQPLSRDLQVREIKASVVMAFTFCSHFDYHICFLCRYLPPVGAI